MISLLELSKQTTLRAVTRTSAKQGKCQWPGDWLKSRRWETINYNESESSSLEGQSKVIRLSISNPFSSLKHRFPFKQKYSKPGLSYRTTLPSHSMKLWTERLISVEITEAIKHCQPNILVVSIALLVLPALWKFWQFCTSSQARYNDNDTKELFCWVWNDPLYIH